MCFLEHALQNAISLLYLQDEEGQSLPSCLCKAHGKKAVPATEKSRTGCTLCGLRHVTEALIISKAVTVKSTSEASYEDR